MRNSLVSALGTRNLPVYAASPQVSERSRSEFRASFEGLLRAQAILHREGESEQRHNEAISAIAIQLSASHGAVLREGRMRIGVVQKALNLYFKFRWCLDESFPTPHHCPIDGIVLRAAGSNGKWTELDDLETYCIWIDQVRAKIIQHGFTSLPEWELEVWQRGRTGRTTPQTGCR